MSIKAICKFDMHSLKQKQCIRTETSIYHMVKKKISLPDGWKISFTKDSLITGELTFPM